MTTTVSATMSTVVSTVTTIHVPAHHMTTAVHWLHVVHGNLMMHRLDHVNRLMMHWLNHMDWLVVHHGLSVHIDHHWLLVHHRLRVHHDRLRVHHHWLCVHGDSVHWLAVLIVHLL